MSDGKNPRLNKVPFWLADTALLVAAATLVIFGGRPLTLWETVAIVICVALGGWLAVLPFLREYGTAVQLGETDRLADTTAKLGQLEMLAGSITGATGQWQGVQERAAQTADLAREVVERLTREAQAFAQAVSKTADGEKQTLKLEVEKLRRSEGEWLLSVGRVMDHVFALHAAAARSGQSGLADQLDRFHAACRDALRRVGFVPFVAAPDEDFDPRKHQPVEGSRAVEGSKVDETVAPGFLFQGRLVRPVIVKLMGGPPAGQVPGEGAVVAGSEPREREAGAGDVAAEAATGT